MLTCHTLLWLWHTPVTVLTREGIIGQLDFGGWTINLGEAGLRYTHNGHSTTLHLLMNFPGTEAFLSMAIWWHEVETTFQSAIQIRCNFMFGELFLLKISIPIYVVVPRESVCARWYTIQLNIFTAQAKLSIHEGYVCKHLCLYMCYIHTIPLLMDW